MKLTRESFQRWKTQEETKIFLRFLRAQVQEIKDTWASGSYTGSSSDATAQLNAMALGRIEALDRVVNLDYEDFGDDDKE